MLWDAIRDFFVQHIFGGYSSNDVLYSTLLGRTYDFEAEEAYDSYLNDFAFTFNDSYGAKLSLGLADWLSTTATIITITIIVILCALFVYKIIKLIGGLIR